MATKGEASSGTVDTKALDAAIEAALSGATQDDDEPQDAAGEADDVEEASEAEPGETPTPAAGDAEEPDEGETADEEPGETPELDAAVKAAQVQLRLAGFKQKELDAMTPEEVVSRWEAVSEREANYRRVRQERAELQRKLEELEAAAAKETERVTAPTVADADLLKLQEPISTEFGDEASAAFTALADGLAKRAMAALVERLDAAERAVGEARGGVAHLVYQAVRDGLVGRYPGLADEAQWEAVRTDAAELLSTTRYSELKGPARLRALIADESKRRGLETAPSQGKETNELDRRQRNGTPTVKTSRSPRRFTGDDRQSKALYAAELAAEGHTADQIRKAVGG